MRRILFSFQVRLCASLFLVSPFISSISHANPYDENKIDIIENVISEFGVNRREAEDFISKNRNYMPPTMLNRADYQFMLRNAKMVDEFSYYALPAAVIKQCAFDVRVKGLPLTSETILAAGRSKLNSVAIGPNGRMDQSSLVRTRMIAEWMEKTGSEVAARLGCGAEALTVAQTFAAWKNRD